MLKHLTLALWITLLPAALAPLPAQAQSSAAVEILLRKARALEDRGRIDLAAQTWKQILLTDPNQAEALSGLARWARDNGRSDEAQGYLERLKQSGQQTVGAPAAPALDLSRHHGRLEEAARLARGGQSVEAMKIYREVFGATPPPGPWSIAYFETLAATPDGWRAGTAGLRRLHNESPSSRPYRLALGRLLTYRPETRAEGIRLLQSTVDATLTGQQARAAWRQALVWDGPKPANRDSLRAFLAARPDPEIQKLLEGLPAVEPARPALMAADEIRGYDHLREGRLDQARAQFEKVLEGTPRSVPALAGLGYVAMKEENFASAVEYLEVAHAAAPKDAAIRANLDEARFYVYLLNGAQALEAREPARARTEFQQAVALRPDDLNAIQGLAGSLLMLKEGAAAVPLYERLTAARDPSPEHWRGLFESSLIASGPRAALDTLGQMPAAVQRTLMVRPGFQLLVAEAHLNGGSRTEATRIIARVTDLARTDPGQVSSAQQLQLAALLLSLGRLPEAERYYREVTLAEPDNAVAWEGLLGVMQQRGREDAAFPLLARIPKATYEAALARTGFLRAAAILQAKHGQPEAAEELLRRLLAAPLPEDERNRTTLLMASVLLARDQNSQAATIASGILETDPASTDAWKILFAARTRQNQSGEAAAVIARMPSDVRAALMDDPGFIASMAAVQEAAGESEAARLSVRTALDRYATLQQTPPAGLQLQLGWLLLNSHGDERELYSVLTALRMRKDLEPAQDAAYREIWSIWVRRRADAARRDGDLKRAAAILEAGFRLLPKDPALRVALAAALVESGDGARALTLYKNILGPESTPSEYLGAISAASAQKDPLASVWMDAALQRFPRDARVLNAAAEFMAQQGDYRRAQNYWRQALVVETLPHTAAAGAAALAPGDPTRSLGTLLLGPEAALPKPADPLASLEPGADALLLSSASSPWSAARLERSLDEKARDGLSAINGRNSPLLGGTTVIQARDGRAGFESRVIMESELAASAVIADSLRLSLVARPTTVSAGRSDATSDLRFGLLPATVGFDNPSQGGLGLEAQVSTETFGLWAGSTPQGFLVRNFVGGFRFRPLGGPLTLNFSREALRDTLLSFAGAQDPVSRQVWGGVTATGATLRTDFGDERGGLYAGGGYQILEGRNVVRNNRIEAFAGGYRRVLTNLHGSLNVGLFAMGMSYRHNLRFFTLGHGGYFSPQRYILVTAPVEWRGSWNRRLQYSIAASAGPQNFREDASPYFPTMPLLQGRTGPYYPDFRSTALNYGLDLRTIYQMNERWFLDAHVNANNARNFSAQSLTFSLRYSLRPQPIGAEVALPSVPDARGRQPFQLSY